MKKRNLTIWCARSRRELRYSASVATMKIQTAQLESCWDLILQDKMLDVAAAIAATEPGPAATPKKPAAAQPVLALHWAVREPIGKAS